jgi:hypothetical protein
MIQEILIKFFNFLPLYLLMCSIFYNIYIIYVFIKCIRKQEKLSENLTKKDSFYFFLSISYIFTYIFL